MNAVLQETNLVFDNLSSAVEGFAMRAPIRPPVPSETGDGGAQDSGNSREGIVIYGPACNVKGLLNQARMGTDAVIYPYMDSSRPASCKWQRQDG
jgi:hypothetical protein